MRRKCMTISMILVLVLLLQMFPAASTVPVTQARTLEKMDDLTLFGRFSEEDVKGAGHIRVTDRFLEEMNMVEYENQDGTYTSYVFSEPVKYHEVNTNTTRYINQKIVENQNSYKQSGYKWKNAANAFDLYFSDTKGLRIQVGNTYIEQSINASSGSKAALKQKMDSALKFADNAAKMEYQYVSTATGCRTNIILSEAPKSKLTVTSLSSGDSLAVAENADGTVTAQVADTLDLLFSAVTVVDATGEFSRTLPLAFESTGKKQGNLCVETSAIPKGAVYPITLSYAEDVEVQSNNTAGVLTCDASPGMTLNFQDTMVHSRASTANYNDRDSMTVGDSSYGYTTEIYVQFDLSAISSLIRYDQLISACFAMYQKLEYAREEEFNLGCYRVAESWDATTVTWDTRPDCDTTPFITECVFTSNKLKPNTNQYEETQRRYHYFMITQLAQGWLQGIPNYGLAFKKNDVFGETRIFTSSEGGTSTTKPFFRMTYTTDPTSLDNIGIKDQSVYFIKRNGLYLTATGSYVTQQPFTGAQNQKWRVIDRGDGYYKLIPQNATYLALAKQGSLVAVSSSTASTTQQFKFTRNWNGTYHIVSRSDTNTGLYSSYNDEGSFVYISPLETSLTNRDDWTLEAVGEDTAYWVMSNEIADDGISLTWVDNKCYAPIVSANWDFEIIDGVPVTSAARLLMSSNFCVLHAHSTPGAMYFPTETDVGEWLVANQAVVANGQYGYGVDAWEANTLASVRCVILAACSTGNDATTTATPTNANTADVYNIASSIYRKGAHLVISFVNPAEAQDWYKTFFEQCAAGQTVAEAMAAADSALLISGGRDYGAALNRNVLGDTSMRLRISEEDGNE